jgi:hypothetical protein
MRRIAAPRGKLIGRSGSGSAPAGIELDELAVLGPMLVLRLSYVPKAMTRKLVAEMWLHPDASRILELSTKCSPGEMFQVAAEGRASLAR